MNLYQIGYTIFETHTREAYVYGMNKESAMTVFKISAADLGLRDTDYEIDYVFTRNHIEELNVMQGAYHEAREDQYNN